MLKETDKRWKASQLKRTLEESGSIEEMKIRLDLCGVEYDDYDIFNTIWKYRTAKSLGAKFKDMMTREFLLELAKTYRDRVLQEAAPHFIRWNSIDGFLKTTSGRNYTVSNMIETTLASYCLFLLLEDGGTPINVNISLTVALSNPKANKHKQGYRPCNGWEQIDVTPKFNSITFS